MSFEADAIVDRRRIRRKLTFWRTATILIAVVAVIGGALAFTARRTGLAGGPGASVARVSITGLIRSDQRRVEALERLSRSSVKAVIIKINSPGGTVAGSEQLYDALVKLKEKKPLVVVIDGLAASGGYIAAMAGDHIIAQQSAIVGSIGVLFQYPNFTDLLKHVGVAVESVKSSPLKAAPSGYEPTSPEARAAIESLVMDSYAWFRKLVEDRRKLDGAALDRVADGRVFTGRQSFEVKLIDELGSEDAARAWLAKEKGVPATTPVRDYSLDQRLGDLSFLRVAAAGVLDAAGLTSMSQRLADGGAMAALERLNLDGLLAVWHPPAGQ